MILALDIGTSSVRGALYDAQAQPISGTTVKVPSQLTINADGRASLDADSAVERVASVVDKVLLQSQAAQGEIEGVAICAFWHSLLGLDNDGRPTTDVLTWADTRSREHTQKLKAALDEDEVHERTGAHFHSSYWPAKLMWLRTAEPQQWNSTDKWVSFSDYLLMRLCGSFGTSMSIASGTGVFDIEKQRWDEQMRTFLGIEPERLPGVQATPASLVGEYAARWPRLQNARWLPPVADGAADSVGSGCTSPGRAALMVGTSAAIRVISGDPTAPLPRGLWCYRLDTRRVIVGGALSDGGNLYSLLVRDMRHEGRAEDEMRRRGAASHGIKFLPFFAGERSTGYHEDARGAMEGVTPSHDDIDILQAGLEAVAFRLAEILERLKAAVPITEIVASGGALRDSSIWPQITADVLGRDMMISDVTESASRGAVLLALESLGKIDSIENVPKPASSTLAFHPECHEIYKRARLEHQNFYDRTFHTNT